MKEEILQLRKEGNSYNQIKEKLGCSLSTISYHCGSGQKEKSLNRLRKLYKDKPLTKKIERFKLRILSEKTRSFQRREGNSLSSRDNTFTLEDVLNKIGETPVCYLSGKKIDISDSKSYSLDHIKSAKDIHDNSLNNLGITTSEINRMKCHLSYDDFIKLCIDILEYQGYEIRKRGE